VSAGEDGLVAAPGEDAVADDDVFALPGMGRAFVFAVPDPVIFWDSRNGERRVQVQVSDSSDFSDGRVLLDAETSEGSMRLGVSLGVSSVLFLRARQTGFFVNDEWTPVVRISYSPLSIGMRRSGDCEMAVYELTNDLLAEIVNRLLPGGEAVVSGGVLMGKDGTPYLGLGELNYGFQFGLEMVRSEGFPGGYALASKRGRADHPAVGLSWYGAAFICDSLSRMFGYEPAYSRIAPGGTAARGGGFRMPTAAEWDYAARGPDSFVYPGGAKTLDPRSANFLRSGDPFETTGRDPSTAGGPTNPVNFYDGTEKNAYKTSSGVSPSGLYDMMGNVWEWCDDIFIEESAETAQTGEAARAAEETVAAGGAENGGEESAGNGGNTGNTGEAGEKDSPQAAGRFRVVRGGAWNTPRADVSLESRGWYKAEGFSYSLGLRPARTP
jgi:formylglycine-generating enzyme required for sulfatase activity